METSASFEARSAPSSYPTTSQSGYRAALDRATGNKRIPAAPHSQGDRRGGQFRWLGANPGPSCLLNRESSPSRDLRGICTSLYRQLPTEWRISRRHSKVRLINGLACTRVKEKGPTPRMVEIEGVGLCTNRLHRLPLLMDLFSAVQKND